MYFGALRGFQEFDIAYLGQCEGLLREYVCVKF